MAVKIRELVKRFGDRLVLKIDTLDVSKGACVGVIGPNGAGKTTLIRIIAGLLEPSSVTTLTVLGRSSTARRRGNEIGLVTDATQLYGTLTVVENLNYMSQLYRVPKRERAYIIDYALEICGLTDRKNDRVITLSTGLKQRANIARALCGRPQLLLLDEPTSGLDPAASQRVYDALLKLQATGITMILCSHLMNEIEDLCNRVLFINGGHIISDATPERMKKIAGELVYTISVETDDVAAKLRGELRDLGLSRTAIRRSNGRILISIYGCKDALVVDALGVEYHKSTATLSDAFILLSEDL
ncbi:MAG: ABC transporter ATP-binding protein [Propionibacteriaceae bacterium]|nr:ABC transporter ATP-binding protein [Propionibacteriaceae bacterium]